MGYYIDLSKISLEQFREKLANGELLPSQQILKDEIDERFQKIKDQKINKINQADFEELYQQLSKINQEKGYFRGKIFLKDMKYLIKDTENVSFEIEY